MVTAPLPDPSSAPRADAPALYTARVENTGGTSGRVRVREASAVEIGTPRPGADGDLTLPTGGPRRTAQGFNPEQFLAMAWSTCLGETLRVVLAEHDLSAQSSVNVEVGLHRDPAGGFRFAPRALVRIDGLDPARGRELAEAAHARCPVSKLLRGQGEPRVELVERPAA
jgi:lipoyl-dependent peroxiredoxin